MTQAIEKLKPCPFCGGEAAIEEAFYDCNHYWAQCQNCKNGTWSRDEPQLAIAAWNRRVEDVTIATQATRIAELEKELAAVQNTAKFWETYGQSRLMDLIEVRVDLEKCQQQLAITTMNKGGSMKQWRPIGDGLSIKSPNGVHLVTVGKKYIDIEEYHIHTTVALPTHIRLCELVDVPLGVPSEVIEAIGLLVAMTDNLPNISIKHALNRKDAISTVKAWLDTLGSQEE